MKNILFKICLISAAMVIGKTVNRSLFHRKSYIIVERCN